MDVADAKMPISKKESEVMEQDGSIMGLAGQFKQHVKSCENNFIALYDKDLENKMTLKDIGNKVDGIESKVGAIVTGMKPMNDIAAFFRVLTILAKTIPAVVVVAGAVAWLFITLTSVTPVGG